METYPGERDGRKKSIGPFYPSATHFRVFQSVNTFAPNYNDIVNDKGLASDIVLCRETAQLYVHSLSAVSLRSSSYETILLSVLYIQRDSVFREFTIRMEPH